MESKGHKEFCSGRTILWYMVFTGTAVNYMIRLNLNIALVSMVQPIQRNKNNWSVVSECFIETFSPMEDILHSPVNSSKTFDGNSTHFLNGTILEGPKHRSADSKFVWNEREQGHILGSFFWLHWMTQIPGGILAAKYGTKLVFGLSNLMGILACLGIPWFAKMGAGYLIFIRVLQGLLSGFAWPSMHNLTAKWIPPNERSRFVTAYLGSSVGAGITYPLCGFIIDRWGWEVVFYVCAAIGIAWFSSWWCLVYDTPSNHPRLSKGEREYILQSLGGSVAKRQAPVPWKHILSDVSVWMNVLSQIGACWGLFTLITNGPAFFKFIHGWNIRATGVLSGMPHIFRMIWAYVVSLLGDYLLRTNKMKRTNVRKLANFCCCGVQGVFVLGLSYSGCDSITAVVLFTLAIIANGAVSTGALASIVDMSPNYASVILGLVNTAVAIVGFCTPAVVGYLTFQNQTIEQWQKVYWIATVFLFTSAITFTLFAKPELKPWNSLETEDVEAEAQGMMKKKKKESNDKFIENIMYSKEEVY